MTRLDNPQLVDETSIIGSRMGRIDPDNFRSQRDEPAANDEDDEQTDADVADDEPVDEDGDPTGEHDHHQDDNYALGGHVTRSGRV